MPTLYTYKIFISHAWSYSDDYYRVENFLNEAPYFLWENLSVPRHNPILNNEQLTKELNNQMRPADVFIVLGGMYTAHSDWMLYEINFARRIGRKILGIKPWGSLNWPLAMQNGADKIVGWNRDSIVNGIRELVP